MDPDMAQAMKDRMAEEEPEDDELEEDEDGEQTWDPQMRSQEGYTPMISMLYSLLDATNEISRTLIAVNGKKPPLKQKMPRPVSAMDLLDLADERDDMHDLAQRFGLRQP